MGGSREYHHHDQDTQGHGHILQANNHNWTRTNASQLTYVHKTASPSRIMSLSAPDMTKTVLYSTGFLANWDKRDTQPKADEHTQDAQRQCYYPTPFLESNRPVRDPLGKPRVWSAKMQLKANRLPPCVLRDSSGPPGTPLTNMLSSLLSEQSDPDSVLIQRESVTDDSLGPSANRLSIFSKQHDSMNNRVPQDRTIKFHTAPASLCRQSLRTSEDEQYPGPSYQPLSPARRLFAQLIPHRGGQPDSRMKIVSPSQLDGPADDGGLCDWEVRLIDGDRKSVV